MSMLRLTPSGFDPEYQEKNQLCHLTALVNSSPMSMATAGSKSMAWANAFQILNGPLFCTKTVELSISQPGPVRIFRIAAVRSGCCNNRNQRDSLLLVHSTHRLELWCVGLGRYFENQGHHIQWIQKTDLFRSIILTVVFENRYMAKGNDS